VPKPTPSPTNVTSAEADALPASDHAGALITVTAVTLPRPLSRDCPLGRHRFRRAESLPFTGDNLLLAIKDAILLIAHGGALAFAAGPRSGAGLGDRPVTSAADPAPPRGRCGRERKITESARACRR
jgi:hypothetical protein